MTSDCRVSKGYVSVAECGYRDGPGTPEGASLLRDGGCGIIIVVLKLMAE